MSHASPSGIVVVTNSRAPYEAPEPKWWELPARAFFLHPYGPPLHGPHRFAIASASYLFFLILVVDALGWGNLFLLVAASVRVPVIPQLTAMALGLGFAYATVVYETEFFRADPTPEGVTRRRLLAAAVGRIAVILGVTSILALCLELLVFDPEIRRRQIEEFLNAARYEATLVHDRVAQALTSQEGDLTEARGKQFGIEADRASVQAALASAEVEGRRAHDARAQAAQGATRAERSAGYWELQATTLTDESQRAVARRLGRERRRDARRLRALAVDASAREDDAATRADQARAQLALANDRVARASSDVGTAVGMVDATAKELQAEWRRVHEEIVRIESGGDPRSLVVNGKNLALHALTPLDRLLILRDLGAAEPPRWPADVPARGRQRAMELFGRDANEAAVSDRLHDRTDVMNGLIWSLRGITIVLPLLAMLLKLLGGAQQYFSLQYQCAMGHPGALRQKAGLARMRGIAPDAAMADELWDATPVHLTVIDDGPAKAAAVDLDAVATPAAEPHPVGQAAAEPTPSAGELKQVQVAEVEPGALSRSAKVQSRPAGTPTNGAAHRRPWRVA